MEFNYRHFTAASTAAMVLAVAFSTRQAMDAATEEQPFTWQLAVIQFVQSPLNCMLLLNFGMWLCVRAFTVVTRATLGQLFPAERQAVQSLLASFVIFKAALLITIMEITLSDSLIWGLWFEGLGVLRVLALLSRLRFQVLAASPGSRAAGHVRLLALMAGVLAADVVLAGGCLWVFWEVEWSLLLILLFDCLEVILETVQALVNYTLFFAEWGERLSERRPAVEFAITSTLSVLTHMLSSAYFTTIWFFNGLGIGLLDFLLIWQLLRCFESLKRDFASIRHYLEVARAMDERFPNATPEELQVAESCTICRQQLTSAKRLPCRHCFHKACLQSWLQLPASNNLCPICRQPAIAAAEQQQQQQDAAAPANQVRQFRLPGFLRAILPNVQFEFVVQRGGGVGVNPGGLPPVTRNTVSDAHVQRVLEVLPHLSPLAVRQDLFMTANVALTIERGLAGHIVAAIDDPAWQAMAGQAGAAAPQDAPNTVDGAAGAAADAPNVDNPELAAAEGGDDAAATEAAIEAAVNEAFAAAAAASPQGPTAMSPPTRIATPTIHASPGMRPLPAPAVTAPAPPAADTEDLKDDDEEEEPAPDPSDLQAVFQYRKRQMKRMARKQYRTKPYKSQVPKPSPSLPAGSPALPPALWSETSFLESFQLPEPVPMAAPAPLSAPAPAPAPFTAQTSTGPAAPAAAAAPPMARAPLPFVAPQGMAAFATTMAGSPMVPPHPWDAIVGGNLTSRWADGGFTWASGVQLPASAPTTPTPAFTFGPVALGTPAYIPAAGTPSPVVLSRPDSITSLPAPASAAVSAPAPAPASGPASGPAQPVPTLPTPEERRALALAAFEARMKAQAAPPSENT